MALPLAGRKMRSAQNGVMNDRRGLDDACHVVDVDDRGKVLARATVDAGSDLAGAAMKPRAGSVRWRRPGSAAQLAAINPSRRRSRRSSPNSR